MSILLARSYLCKFGRHAILFIYEILGFLAQSWAQER
jgi:hypothetical protein